MEQKNTFTEGAILVPLLKFSLPILCAIFLQAMYGAVDLIIVGQFGDASGVSGGIQVPRCRNIPRRHTPPLWREPGRILKFYRKRCLC